jgi:cytochrome o ubiquinol oxidase subunit 3
MTDNHQVQREKSPDPHHDLYSKTIFGFWLFLLNDFILFGSIFATFIVLAKNPYWTSLPMGLFDIHYATWQSFLLLFASFTAGLGGASAHRKDRNNTLLFFSLTFVFALFFMYFEYADFSRLIEAGLTWDKTAYLSGFYTILATHGLHVLLGIIWIPVLLIPVILEGVTSDSIRRLSCLRMFFQFLNIVWIFIYTIVYFIHGAAV